MNFRALMLLVFLACAGLLGYAYYAQYALYLEPCPLCVLQRLAFMVAGVFALAGAVHAPSGAGRWIYGGGILAGAGWGIVTSGRHVWLQNLPPEQVPDCGPGLGYMLEHFPLTEAIQSAFTAAGECAEVDWQFMGLSMPAWTLLWFAALAGVTLWAMLRTQS